MGVAVEELVVLEGQRVERGKRRGTMVVVAQ